MTWGVPRRPKISNKLGSPTPGEGSDGDIQVRQTNVGARLFAKLGGRWFNTSLDSSAAINPEVSIAKCWTFRGVTPAAQEDPFYVYLPDYIQPENVIYIGFMIQIRGDVLGYVPVTFGEDGTDYLNAVELEMAVGYQQGNHRIKFQSGSAATSADNRKFSLTVFFK